ncbi:MAG: hypothetical protein AAFX76_11510 [Planctomycetota bacterium]
MPRTSGVPGVPKQAKRRWVYGLNVAVAAAAAVALTVAVNWLVDGQVSRLPVGAKSLLRIDLTATRAFTLAPQTRQTLGSLDDGARLVAVLRVDDKAGQDVADLLAEYDDFSPAVTAEVIDPDREAARLELFYRELEARYADEVAPLRAAVEAGLEALAALERDIAQLQERVDALIADEGVDDVEARRDLQLLSNRLGEVGGAYTRVRETLDEAVSRPLAPWSNARDDLRNALTQAEAEVLGPFARQFRRTAERRGAPLGVRDAMLRMGRQIDATRTRLRGELEALNLPGVSERYDRLLAGLRAGEVVVLLVGERERVVPVTEMFVAGGADSTEAGGGRTFIGEDRLTGALATMAVARTPRVVFVRDTPGSLERGSGLTHVASRLAAVEFELAEWRVGDDNASAQGEAAATLAGPPLPGEGQPAVWVVPGLSPQRTTQAQREQVAGVLADRLAAGDGVLLCFSYDPEAQFRPADALADLARAWGVSPRTHQMVLREGLGPDGRPRGEAGWRVTDWPADSPVGDALAGREVQFVAASPLSVDPPDAVETRPLARLDDGTGWVAEGLTTPAEIAAAASNEDNRADGVVIAAAAQRDAGGRLMVFGERHWLGDTQASRRLGNSELFVNGVYWLAGLDDAIAATPRTQDLRRIGAIGEGAALTYRLTLLAGMPALALAVGAGVWWVRRRG